MPIFLIFFSCLFFINTVIADEIIDLGKSPDKRYHLTLHLDDKNGWSAMLGVFDNKRKKQMSHRFEASYMIDSIYRNFSLYWINNRVFRLNTNGYPAESADFYTVTIKKHIIINHQNVVHGNKILNRINDYLISYGEVEGIGSIYLTRVDNGEEIFSVSGMIGQEFCPYDYSINLTKDKRIGIFSQSPYIAKQWEKTASNLRKSFMCFPKENKKQVRKHLGKPSLLGILDTKTKEFIPDSIPYKDE